MGKRLRHANKDSAEGKTAIQNVAERLRGLVRRRAVDVIVDGALETEERRPRTINIRTTPVCWGFPADEVTFTRWTFNVMTIRPMPWDDIITSINTYLPNARNNIHGQFLASAESMWLFMLDSDVLPPPDIIDRLLKDAVSLNAHMVGGWYKKKQAPFLPVVYDFNRVDENGITLFTQRTKRGKGIEEVTGAGAGCWLMSRDLATALGSKPYDMAIGGEDLVLCRKVSALGYKMFIDWDLACAHTGVGYI